jgi:hypothetical protein
VQQKRFVTNRFTPCRLLIRRLEPTVGPEVRHPAKVFLAAEWLDISPKALRGCCRFVACCRAGRDAEARHREDTRCAGRCREVGGLAPSIQVVIGLQELRIVNVVGIVQSAVVLMYGGGQVAQICRAVGVSRNILVCPQNDPRRFDQPAGSISMGVGMLVRSGVSCGFEQFTARQLDLFEYEVDHRIESFIAFQVCKNERPGAPHLAAIAIHDFQ